jgi:biopolymer transport protein ExbD
MVAAPMLQRGVELKLPVASKSDELSSERIFIDVPLSYRKEKRVFLDKESIGMPALAERLRQLMVNRTDKQVFLRMDSQLFIQEQIDVMQELKAAGILNVGIVTELPAR